MDIQDLLDLEAELGNLRYKVHQHIKNQRGDNPPVCYGTDDCSTMFLVTCPFRIDCYEGLDEA